MAKAYEYIHRTLPVANLDEDVGGYVSVGWEVFSITPFRWMETSPNVYPGVTVTDVLVTFHWKKKRERDV